MSIPLSVISALFKNISSSFKSTETDTAYSPVFACCQLTSFLYQNIKYRIYGKFIYSLLIPEENAVK